MVTPEKQLMVEKKEIKVLNKITNKTVHIMLNEALHGVENKK